MSRFNKNTTQSAKTVNFAGGEAYQESPKLELVSLLLTSFVKDQFYRSANESLNRLEKLVQNNEPLFCAKAAIYARTEFGMRSITHALAGELGHDTRLKGLKNGGYNGCKWGRSFFNKIVYRVDDMTEIMAYYLGKYGKPIPNAMKKGFAEAINRFDRYQLAKYRGENKRVSLVDVVNLVHPKPANNEIAKALKDLVNGELVSENTWETNLTKAGQVAETEEEKKELKKDTWVKLIKSRKLGYFALLKNLRNIIQQAPEVVDETVKMLTDKKLIKKSLVLPFRYITAYTELAKINAPQIVIDGLEKAIQISLSNCPDMRGSVVAVDLSGSMVSRPWMNGRFGSGDYATTASLFAAIMANKGADVVVFSDEAKYVSGIISGTPAITLARIIYDSMGHNGTNFQSIFDVLRQPYKRVIILSDEQGWVGYYAPRTIDYRNKFNTDPHIYSIDLAGYGTLQFPEHRVYAIAGFSDKILDIMKLLESDKEALIHKIESVEI